MQLAALEGCGGAGPDGAEHLCVLLKHGRGSGRGQGTEVGEAGVSDDRKLCLGIAYGLGAGGGHWAQGLGVHGVQEGVL